MADETKAQTHSAGCGAVGATGAHGDLGSNAGSAKSPAASSTPRSQDMAAVTVNGKKIGESEVVGAPVAAQPMPAEARAKVTHNGKEV